MKGSPVDPSRDEPLPRLRHHRGRVAPLLLHEGHRAPDPGVLVKAEAVVEGAVRGLACKVRGKKIFRYKCCEGNTLLPVMRERNLFSFCVDRQEFQGEHQIKQRLLKKHWFLA